MPIHGYPGNVITANPVAPTSSVASGVWTTEQQLKAVAAGNWPFTIPTQQISRSLRFNSADSAYLNRTFTTPTNNKIFTFSTWVKRSGLAANQTLFDAFVPATSFDTIRFNSSDQLDYFDNTAGYLTSTQVFRDVSAWYHIVAAVDTTQATSSNRVKLYVNGIQITAFSASAYPSQNQAVIFNSAVAHGIGRFGYSANAYLNGYMTEVYFIDGQALTPSSFGRTSTTTGVWEPLAYTGTYGTNGFYVNFSDNSNTTAATLGKDYSGNGNNWTPNNFSVTAGAGNDSLVDSPTSYGTDTGVGGEVRGNYATLNPLSISGTATIRNGNLDIAYTGADGAYGAIGTVGVSSGKWYFETTLGSDSTFYVQAGFLPTDSQQKTDIAYTLNSNYATGGYADVFELRRGTGSGGTLISSSSTTPAAGGVFGVSFDIDVGEMRFYYNGTQLNVAITSGIATGKTWVPFVGLFVNDGMSVNFGQRAFAYTAPSGFKALCTQNLPTPTIGATSTTQANRYMDIKLYTGNGGQQTQTGLNFQPDFIWVKSRNNAYDNGLANAVTGTGKYLVSNSTAAEVTDASGSIIAFNANGFGQGGSNPFGANAATYVAWCWRASNAAGVTNTAGTITSTVSANTTSGFSIVTYTGNGSAGATVGHGLGVTPDMIIVKSRSVGTGDWVVWHSSLTSSNNNYLILNSTAAVNTANQPWNNTLPTSSVFSLRTWDSVNQNGSTYVAYCFDAVAGYSAFGSYTGNGSSDGPFVYTGFRPEYVMIKVSSAGTNGWQIRDVARDPYNTTLGRLYANLSNAEGTTSGNEFDILSNGFKVRNSGGDLNSSSQTYIYMAFAESPFKYSLAR
jgi:hypothetical protein